MNVKTKMMLCSLFVALASIATCKVTWFGLYEPKTPAKLAK